MLNYSNIRLPEKWKDRQSISAKELRDLLAGKIKDREKQGPKLRTNNRQDYATFKDGVLTIVIHELPVSLNQRKQWHWSVVATEKERWEQIIWAIILEAGRPVFSRPVVQVTFYFPDNRPRDPQDNYMSWKALTDGLTRAGVIPDDCWQHTKVLAPGAFVDRQNPRTEIVVREEE